MVSMPPDFRRKVAMFPRHLLYNFPFRQFSFRRGSRFAILSVRHAKIMRAQMQARGGALLRTGHGLAVQELVCRIQCTTFAVADSVPQFRYLRYMACHWVIQHDLRPGTSHNHKYQGCNVSAAQRATQMNWRIT